LGSVRGGDGRGVYVELPFSIMSCDLGGTMALMYM
jgi:hypothetical protein